MSFCDQSAATIRELNDRFRQSFVGGQVVMTSGIAALPPEIRAEVVEGVKTFSDFDIDNDPHGEHDFGAIEVAGTRIFWKIDYYDRAMRCHSPDASNPAVTQRLLTVMLVDEN